MELVKIIKVSLVIPVYNIEAQLSKCLDSVVAQTYSNIEIILVNDGSTDNSGSICQKYSEQDERIIVINQENGGLSAARNSGIKIATGDYMFFLDSDDFIDECTIECLVDAVQKYNVDIAACSYLNFYESDSYDDVPKVLKDDVKFECVSVNEFYLQTITNHAWGKLYKSELFKGKNILYPKGRNYEDIATTYKLFMQVKKVARTDAPMYKYLIRKGAISQSFSQKNFLDMVYAYKSILRYIDKNVLNEKHFRYYLSTLLFTINSMIFKTNFEDQSLPDKYIKWVRSQFSKISSGLDLMEFRGKPMTMKLMLYKYHMSNVLLKARKFFRR